MNAWRRATRLGSSIPRSAHLADLPRRYRLNACWVYQHVWEHEVNRQVRGFREAIEAAGVGLAAKIRGDHAERETDRSR